MDRVVAIIALLLMLWYGARYIERHEHEFSRPACEEQVWDRGSDPGIVGSIYGAVDSVYGSQSSRR